MIPIWVKCLWMRKKPCRLVISPVLSTYMDDDNLYETLQEGTPFYEALVALK